MTTLQLQVMVMHHWPQLQRQRVMSTLQRERVFVALAPPREVAVAMEWRDPAVAVVGAVAGEVSVAVAVVAAAQAVEDAEAEVEVEAAVRYVPVSEAAAVAVPTLRLAFDAARLWRAVLLVWHRRDCVVVDISCNPSHRQKRRYSDQPSNSDNSKLEEAGSQWHTGQMSWDMAEGSTIDGT
jgi:hypothetical protein